MVREKHMVRVRNAHPSMVAKVAPGQTGMVDANNPGVAIALKAGLLQPVRDDGLVLPSTDEGKVPASELRAAVAEIDRLNAHCREMEHELVVRDRELGELRAQVEALTAPKPPVEKPPKAPKES